MIKCFAVSAETKFGIQAPKAGKNKKSDDHDSFVEERYARRLSSDFVSESLAVLRSQATATNIFMNEIRSTFSSFEKRLDKMEERLDSLEGTMKASMEKTDVVREYVESNEEMITKVQEVTETIKARQNVMLSEVRLISLYKMTEHTSTLVAGHGSGLAVDGQFVNSEWSPASPTRTFTHTGKGTNEKISIDLGALFRVHRVKIWQARHCCLARSIGLRILADGRLLGVTSSEAMVQDFKVAENDPIYANSITVHRLEAGYIQVSEIQVWGTGPFAKDDKFA